MKKMIFSFLCLYLLFNLFVFNTYAEVSQADRETMQKIADAMKPLVQAWTDNYKAMSKYHEPYYTYQKTILGKEPNITGVAYLDEKTDEGNISVVFHINNKLNKSLNVEKTGYYAIDKRGNAYKLEFIGVVYNQGINGSPIVNPNQEIAFVCISPFKDYHELQDIKVFYLRNRSIGRIYFFSESNLEEYSKPEERILRKVKDFFIDFF